MSSILTVEKLTTPCGVIATIPWSGGNRETYRFPSPLHLLLPIGHSAGQGMLGKSLSSEKLISSTAGGFFGTSFFDGDLSFEPHSMRKPRELSASLFASFRPYKGSSKAWSYEA